MGAGFAGSYTYWSGLSERGADATRLPSPIAEFAFPAECRKYLVLRARTRGQSSSSRHWLAPITKSFTGLGWEKSLAMFLKR